jgi:hypothetical protein
MPNYPKLPNYSTAKTMDAVQIYTELQQYTDTLTFELDVRDEEINSRPTNKIYSVVTVTEIGRPSPGDIAFSLGEEKFKGYVSSTGWVNLN